jgi:hypothetical protein
VTTAFQSNAFQNNAFQIDAVQTNTTTRGGAFTKRPDRKARRWARAEDLYTPEELAREVALIEQHLDRARNAKQKVEREKQAQLAANRIQEVVKDEEVAEVVAAPVPAKVDYTDLKRELAGMQKVVAQLKELSAEIAREEAEMDDEDVIMLLVH